MWPTSAIYFLCSEGKLFCGNFYWKEDFWTRIKLSVNWSKWMMMKRGKVDKQGKSMVASYKVPGDIQSGLTNDWEQWGWCFLPVWHPGLIPVYQKNSCTLLFSGLRSSWNLVKPLLRMNEAWMDECACRLQPLVDQYQPIQHETFTIEKFRDLIVITRSCPGEKNLLKKFLI